MGKTLIEELDDMAESLFTGFVFIAMCFALAVFLAIFAFAILGLLQYP